MLLCLHMLPYLFVYTCSPFCFSSCLPLVTLFLPSLECNERLFSSISHALIFVDVFSDSFLLFPVLLYWLLAFLNHIQFCMNDIGSLLPGAFVYTAWYYWTDTTSFSQKACWESSMSNGSKRFRFCSLYLLD